MNHIFNDLEGLRIAAEMERRGEAFYRSAAKLSKNAEAIAMLQSLAEDERNHLLEFQRLYDMTSARREEGDSYGDEVNAYLSAVAADIVFPGGLMEFRSTGFDSIEAVLAYAIASEKDSILFYSELSQHASDPEARDMFLEIVRQEKAHLHLLCRKLHGLESEEEA